MLKMSRNFSHRVQSVHCQHYALPEAVSSGCNHLSHKSQTVHCKRSDMEELLTSVSPQLVDEFAEDFFANRGRELLHDSKRWRVLNSWVGEPKEYSRFVAQCP